MFVVGSHCIVEYHFYRYAQMHINLVSYLKYGCVICMYMVIVSISTGQEVSTHRTAHLLMLFIRGSSCIIEGFTAASQISYLLTLQPKGITAVCFGSIIEHIGSEVEKLL